MSASAIGTDRDPIRHVVHRGCSRRVPAFALAIAIVGAACGAGVSPGASTAPASPSGSAIVSGEMPIYAPGGTYASVTPQRLAEMLRTKDFVLVNVHVPYEGEIEGTDLFIPYDRIEARLSELPSARSARIVLYCRSGRMSAEAARTLVRLGYTDIRELDGGMIAWEAAGLPLVQKPRA